MYKSQKSFDSFIFTHIPKCGGTSFRHFINESALASGTNINELYIPGCNNLPYNKNIGQLNQNEIIKLRKTKIKILANHSKYQEHKQLDLNINNPFYFTILRDPIKRFISHYNFFYYTNGIDNLKNIPLNELDSNALEKLVGKLKNLQIKYLTNVKYVRAVGDENMFKIAWYNLMRIYSGFGVLEDMPMTIELLMDYSPSWISFKRNMPFLNQSNNNSQFQEGIKPSIIDLISKENYWDIKLYEMAKEQFYKRIEEIHEY